MYFQYHEHYYYKHCEHWTKLQKKTIVKRNIGYAKL